MARRLDTLEAFLGYRVIERKSEGFELTEAGSQLAPKASEIERRIQTFSRDASRARGGKENQIIVQAPEGLGTHWISKNLTRGKKLSGASIDLICSDILPDLGRSMVDISVQYQKADNPEHVQILLGHLRILPFASRSYIAEFGVPNCPEELIRHRIISQIGPHDTVDLWHAHFKGEEIAQLETAIHMRTNSGSAQYYAVKGSVGIGGLPTYGVQEDDDLCPIEIGIQQLVPIYMVYQKDKVRNRVAFNKAMRWTKQIFDPRKHQYFAND